MILTDKQKIERLNNLINEIYDNEFGVIGFGISKVKLNSIVCINKAIKKLNELRKKRNIKCIKC